MLENKNTACDIRFHYKDSSMPLYKRRAHFLFLSVGATLFLSGCVPKALEEPAMQSLTLNQKEIAAETHTPLMTQAHSNVWWKAVDDAPLQSLIDHSLSDAPTLASMRARIAQAYAQYDISSTQTEPSLNLIGSADTNHPSKNDLISPPLVPNSYETGRLGVQLTYDLDLWDKLSEQLKAQLGSIKVQEAAYEARVVALSIALSTEYYRYGYTLEKIVILNQEKELLTTLSSLANERYLAGLDDKSAWLNAQSRLNEIERYHSQMSAQLIAAKKALGNLSGLSSEALQPYLPHAFIYSRRFDTTPSIMLDALAQKPEIRAKKEMVEATSSQINVAKAGFYPNINLSALSNFASLGLSNLLRTDSITSMAQASISLPIFDRKALEGAYKASQNAHEAAIYDYNDAVITSANALLSALKNFKTVLHQNSLSQEDMKTKEHLLALAVQKFDEGISDKRLVLQKQWDVLEAKRTILETQFVQINAYIDIMHALGGQMVEGKE